MTVQVSILDRMMTQFDFEQGFSLLKLGLDEQRWKVILQPTIRRIQHPQQIQRLSSKVIALGQDLERLQIELVTQLKPELLCNVMNKESNPSSQ